MKTLLSEDQLRVFVPLLRDLFAHVEKVRASAPLGLQVKRLQIPQGVSESIAAHVLNSGSLGVRLQVTPSRSRGDLEAATQTGIPAKLEVKATSETAFQQFGEKDLAADVLVWLHFDDFFWNPSQRSIWVHFLPKPRTVIPAPTKMDLSKFLDIAHGKVLSTTVDLIKLLHLDQEAVGAGP